MRPDRIELILRAMPGTTPELTQRTGLPRSTTHSLVHSLQLVNWVHVPRWAHFPKTGNLQPVWHAGHGPNEPKPEARTPAEYQKKCREKAKLDGRHEQYLERRRKYAKKTREAKAAEKDKPKPAPQPAPVRREKATIFDALKF